MLMRISETLLERFLLGGLAEEKRREIEDLALRDEEVFDLIEAIEAEIVDRYVRGELSSEDRRAFERRLAPLGRIRRRIAHARVLAAAADEHVGAAVSTTPDRSRRLSRRVLAIAASVLVAAIGTFVAYRADLGPWASRTDRPSVEGTEPSVTYELAPGSLRAAASGQLVERDDQAWIGFRLDLDHPSVRPSSSGDLELVLESAARGEVIERRRVTSEELAAGSLTWMLRGASLEPGDYTILLRAGPPQGGILANYEITVR